MKKKPESIIDRLREDAKKIKVSAHLNTIQDPPFVSKKMEEARKILKESGVPKWEHFKD